MPSALMDLDVEKQRCSNENVCVPSAEMKERFVADVEGLKEFLASVLDVYMVQNIQPSLTQVYQWAERYSRCLMHRVDGIRIHFGRIMDILYAVNHPRRAFVMRLVQDLWMRATAEGTLPKIECLTPEGLYENPAVTTIAKRRKQLVASLREKIMWQNDMAAQLNQLDFDRTHDIWPSDVLTEDVATQFHQARTMFDFARNRQVEPNFLLEENIVIVTHAMIDGARHRGFSIIALVMNSAFKPLVDFDTKQPHIRGLAMMYDLNLVTSMPTFVIPPAPLITTEQFNVAWKMISDMMGV